MIKNGLIMEHIATGYPDEIALNSKECNSQWMILNPIKLGDDVRFC